MCPHFRPWFIAPWPFLYPARDIYPNEWFRRQTKTVLASTDKLTAPRPLARGICTGWSWMTDEPQMLKTQGDEHLEDCPSQ
jgi:hypothetical protein